jgi:phage terminase small subunit
MTDRPLTPKQQAFVAAYVGEAKGNATQAARLAGYEGNDLTLRAVGAENLTKPAIIAALDVFRMATHTEAIMSAQEMAERLSRLSRGDETLTEKRLVSGGKDGFVVEDMPPLFTHQLEAMKALAKMRGYDAPTRSEVAMVATLAPEAEANLIAYLRSKR